MRKTDPAHRGGPLGIKALARDGATLTAKPRKVKRREHNYIHHSTQVLIANLEIATGNCLAVKRCRQEKRHVFLFISKIR
jgi:hypothetical protein